MVGINFKLLLFAIASLTIVSYSVDVFADISNNVYQIPNIDFDKYSYTWGEEGKLFVESSLDNKDPQRVEVITADNSTFKFQMHVNPDSTIQENFVLIETGPDTGVFEWTFIISEPQTKTAYDVDNNYIIVSKSTESIIFQFDVDSNTGYANSAKITHSGDSTLPSDEQRQRIHGMYPSIQFRNGTLTSPYDGQGIVTVQYPSQNKSPTTIDQLKVAFSAYDAQRVFEILNETGPDTGVFEGPVSFSGYKSFSKIYLIEDDSNARSLLVYYLVSDTFSSKYSNNVIIHHGLEYSDNNSGRINQDSVLYVTSDKKAYLDNQSIKVSGLAEPGETVNVSVLSNRGSFVLFEKVHADKDGKFETEFALSNPYSSGTYAVEAVSTTNDKQVESQIVITSMDDLKSRSILIPPLQQSKMGLDADQIVCKQVWKSVLKPNGDSPACVKLPTYTKLLERGWAPVT